MRRADATPEQFWRVPTRQPSRKYRRRLRELFKGKQPDSSSSAKVTVLFPPPRPPRPTSLNLGFLVPVVPTIVCHRKIRKQASVRRAGKNIASANKTKSSATKNESGVAVKIGPSTTTTPTAITTTTSNGSSSVKSGSSTVDSDLSTIKSGSSSTTSKNSLEIPVTLASTRESEETKVSPEVKKAQKAFGFGAVSQSMMQAKSKAKVFLDHFHISTSRGPSSSSSSSSTSSLSSMSCPTSPISPSPSMISRPSSPSLPPLPLLPLLPTFATDDSEFCEVVPKKGPPTHAPPPPPSTPAPASQGPKVAKVTIVENNVSREPTKSESGLYKVELSSTSSLVQRKPRITSKAGIYSQQLAALNKLEFGDASGQSQQSTQCRCRCRCHRVSSASYRKSRMIGRSDSRASTVSSPRPSKDRRNSKLH
ncbi:hypothetical protein BGZ80_000358 [Entomortierella chlamydospora]|uniref:Uncharacterized protein n=1 Tax=Entomortierella chlamydospora TaxID=101097 RepID=A0A9P6SYM6_9FUNG|nr:hypothetical protein BGZ80_000358 [Entomortierella chlamydospora]